jgi:uncharacterized C2H2 Zn-finger protein
MSNISRSSSPGSTGTRTQLATGTSSVNQTLGSTGNHVKVAAPKSQPIDSAELLSLFETSLFVDAKHLLTSVTMGTKDESGRMDWLTLDPKFHSELVKTCCGLLTRRKVTFQLDLMKKVLFSFLLRIINGDNNPILGKAKVEAALNREQREKRRLRRKRSRAAKRERAREEPKIAKLPPKDRKCDRCDKVFTSRKTFSKHTCADLKAKEREEAKASATLKKRERRARARAAKKDSLKAVIKIAAATTSSGTSVTGESREACKLAHPVCEGGMYDTCTSPSVGIRLGRYPKCSQHAGIASQFEPYLCHHGTP